MYCTNCGKKVDSSHHYCTFCGKEINHYSANRVSSEKKRINYSLILGIFSILCLLYPVISVPLAILSIVFNLKEKKNHQKENMGIILGILSLSITIFLFLSTLFVVPLAKEWISDIDFDDDEYDIPVETVPELSGYQWVGNDGSTLFLKKDGTFEWNQKANNTDRVLLGKYEAYTGEEAIQYIEDNLSQYKFFDEDNNKSTTEQLQYFCLLVLHSNTIDTMYFYGNLSVDGKELDLTNIQENNTLKLKRQDKISGIDI